MKKLIKFTLVIVPCLTSLIIAILTLGDYGINWDEPYHYRRGQAYLRYYLTGKKTYSGMPKYPALKGTSDSGSFRNSDKLFAEVQNNPLLSDPSFRRSYYQDDAWNGEYFIDLENAYGHPAFNDIFAALSNYIFYQKLGIMTDLEAYHLFIVLTVSLAIFTVAIFMWEKYGLIESLISSLALITYPLLLGEQHFNIKDPVEMTFYTLTLIYFYLGITKKRFSWLIFSTLSFAIALAVKFNIVFAIIPLGVWLIYYFRKNKPQANFLKRLFSLLFISPLIILAAVFFANPSIWKNPAEQLAQMAKFYLEAGYSQSQPANYYLFGFVNSFPSLWIAVTTPPVTLLLFLSAFFFIRKVCRKDSFALLLFLWFFTALLRISLFKSLSYNGVRLIMEYIPAMAMISGISAGIFFKKIRRPGLKFTLLFLILAGFAPTLIKLVRIHPNENVYFNFLIGGLKGAKEKNLNSWGNSNGNAYFPALLWLNQHAEANAKLTLPISSISNIPRFKLRKDIALSANYWSGPAHQGEYVLELIYDYAPMQWYSLKYLDTAMKPIYEVQVDGIAIAKLWKNSPEYLLPELAKEKVIGAKISSKEGFLELTLPQTEEIMHISLRQPSKNCAALKTGYLATSLDGKNWIRETEDLARDQLRHAKLRDLEEKFDFYLVAKEAKYIRLHAENKDACLLAATKAEVSVLADN